MSDRTVRVISLLPAATEIVASLGMLDALLGVSHECDYPEEVSRKPRVTHCGRAGCVGQCTGGRTALNRAAVYYM